MVPMYVLMLVALSALARVLSARAARMERKYTRAAMLATELAKAGAVKPGNGSTADPFITAKRQYDLGRLVEVRDRLESKFLTWQARAESVSAFAAQLRRWQGRAVPYLFGIADVSIVLVALHLLGLPHGLTTDTVSGWAEALRK